MNAIKNGIVIVALLVVGYGAHVVLNKPIVSEEEPQSEFVSPPETIVDMTAAESLRPDLEAGNGEDTDMSTVAINNDDERPLEMGVSSEPVRRAAEEIDSSASAEHTELLTGEPDSAPAWASAPDSLENGAPGQPAEIPNDPGFEPSDSEGEGDLIGQEVADRSTGNDMLESVWNSTRQHLQRNDLSLALYTLSVAYSSEETTDRQRQEMLPLLDQLAGTVIFSRQHFLEAPYIVKDGDTLAEIASRFQVPEMLLAKINGVQSPSQLVAGETLKVVAGPFRAEARLSAEELTLFLGRYYAGRFPLRLGKDAPIDEMTLRVSEMLGPRTFVDQETGQEIAAGARDNPYGRNWIGLAGSDSVPTEGALFSIHGTGQSCPEDDTRGCLGLASRDAEDLRSILTVGSTVTILR